MIGLCIFDMGGVICRGFDIGPKAAEALGMPLGAFRAYAAPMMDAFMRGELGAAEFWKRFELTSGARVKEDYWTTLFKPTLDIPTVDLALELAAGGRIRVVCGSNTIPAHYEIHKGRGQYDCFDRVYASHLMGVAKPNEDFWRRILREEGVGADQAFFVDDNPENVAAARRLGIESRLYSSAESLRAELVGLGAFPGTAAETSQP